MQASNNAAAKELGAFASVWSAIRAEAVDLTAREPTLRTLLETQIISAESDTDIIARVISARLAVAKVDAEDFLSLFHGILLDHADIRAAIEADLLAVRERDPACTTYLHALLNLKGFHALQTHRLAHWLLNRGRRDFALYLQSRSSSVFQTDINPAARIGKGIFLDHATGLVVGETAVIGDNVSILHGVTLGGTGKEGADRHPKIGTGVMIGAGAKILGNIEIGFCSRVAAGSVVLKPVPPKTTVAGVPAKVVGEAGCSEPARVMDQVIGADI